MGGAAPTPTSKGGKKALDAAINLVPFIDLLSCCLSFLLITAVWTQLARMDVTQKGQGAAGSTDEKPPEAQLSLGRRGPVAADLVACRERGERLEREPRADRLGAVPEQAREMVHLARLVALEHDRRHGAEPGG